MSKKRNATRSAVPNGLFPDEDPDIWREMASIVDDPKQWSEMPNDQLGGQKPKDLIDSSREQQVRDLLRAIKYGMVS